MLKQFFKQFFQKDNEALRQALQCNPRLIDVRTPAEFASGSVPSAINVPVQNLNGFVNKFNKSEVVITFCRSGSRSAMAAQILKKNGFQRAVNGGSWQNVQHTMNQMQHSS